MINPKKDGKRFTRGSAEEKCLREISLFIDKELVNSDQFVGGLATFPSGATAPLHAHPDAEEINIVVQREGDFITSDGNHFVRKGDWQFIPKGVEHSHRNTGKGPFTIVWFYSPPTKSAPK